MSEGISGYGSLQAMSESSFRHVREAAEALEATGLDVSAAIRKTKAEKRDNAAWFLAKFGQ